jgi:heme/copper-type cytochrome/quinol oxidase subunit 2
MRLKMCALVVTLAVLAAPALALAADADAGPLGKTIPPDKRESLKRATALFIITVLILLMMVIAAVILGVFLRRTKRALEEGPPAPPTELEDLWWQANLPEEDKKDKPDTSGPK